MKTIDQALAGIVLLAVVVAAPCGARGQFGRFSRWDRPPRRLRPHPINAVLPWYRPDLIYGTTHTWPNYNAWGRWDDPRRGSTWDGPPPTNSIAPAPQPQPAPRRGKTRPRPRMFRWNAATGRSEEVELGRWDSPQSPQAAPPEPAPLPNPLPALGGLHRWDAVPSGDF